MGCGFSEDPSREADDGGGDGEHERLTTNGNRRRSTAIREPSES
jgi:hypothetical protein